MPNGPALRLDVRQRMRNAIKVLSILKQESGIRLARKSRRCESVKRVPHRRDNKAFNVYAVKTGLAGDNTVNQLIGMVWTVTAHAFAPHSRFAALLQEVLGDMDIAAKDDNIVKRPG